MILLETLKSYFCVYVVARTIISAEIRRVNFEEAARWEKRKTRKGWKHLKLVKCFPGSSFPNSSNTIMPFFHTIFWKTKRV
jgi:hypothetical protein